MVMNERKKKITDYIYNIYFMYIVIVMLLIACSEGCKVCTDDLTCTGCYEGFVLSNVQMCMGMKFTSIIFNAFQFKT